ncbi:MAG: nitrite/sulfite reductase [Cytophagaceae bacterium]|jgi:sulfite reductase (ferredoxin)|nr:nitrite/sulfite reductase [Cytophagaceae bacterium]
MADQVFPFAPQVSEAAQFDIQELDSKIKAFRNNTLDSEKFRSFRLTRGVYGQRQEGVQMIRIKLPYGKVTPEQLLRIADISDKYASGNLHLTTRQDIQIHFVKLENAPLVWNELEEVGVTLREACGNTVRNITASYTAGIDPTEPFDVTPYAHALFEYFLRNPICQEMGRKFKIAFSSSEEDTAFGYMHDLGFLPKVKLEDGKEIRGFKVYVAGGLGAQPFLAHEAFDFLPENKIIPFTTAVIRVFDRYGERSKRHKARLKYLVNGIGMEAFMQLVQKEWTVLSEATIEIDRTKVDTILLPSSVPNEGAVPVDPVKFDLWVKTNVFEQKQKGYYGVQLRQPLGDLASDKARIFAAIVQKYASPDIRITVNQGWLLKFVNQTSLPALFNELNTIGLAEPGFDSTTDITACPGTDTCNLGIASSTGLTEALEKMMKEEFPDIIFNKNIKIKISGCMNACGQHTIGNIGFHGMSIKKGTQVLPAMQVMLGGGLEPDGIGSLADKVIKLPTKRCPDAVKHILLDYENNALEGEYFNAYYRRQVAVDKMYFYKMLKPLSELETIVAEDFVDWGHSEAYVTEVGVGECAGVVVDLISTLLFEAEEKLQWTLRIAAKGNYTDAAYAAYATFVCGAKALLTGEGVACNTQMAMIQDFQKHLVDTGKFDFGGSFESFVLQISEVKVDAAFAQAYIQKATTFIDSIKTYRVKQAVTID